MLRFLFFFWNKTRHTFPKPVQLLKAIINSGNHQKSTEAMKFEFCMFYLNSRDISSRIPHDTYWQCTSMVPWCTWCGTGAAGAAASASSASPRVTSGTWPRAVGQPWYCSWRTHVTSPLYNNNIDYLKTHVVNYLCHNNNVENCGWTIKLWQVHSLGI